MVGNIKEQLLARARLEEKGSGKVSILMVGGSQMGRIAGEMERIGGDVVRVHNWQKIPGEWTTEKLEKLKERVMEDEFVPDKVVIGEALRTPLSGMGLRDTGDLEPKRFGGSREGGEARLKTGLCCV